MAPTVDVLMLAWNRLDATRRTVESYRRHVRVPYRLICVDNGSTDGTLEYLRANADLVIANSANVGAVRGRNQLMAVSDADYLLFSDNDLEFTADVVAGLLAHAERDERIGIVGPLLNQHVAELGLDADLPIDVITAELARSAAGRTKADACIASCCALFRRAVVEAVGPWDVKYHLYAYEDFDYCQQAQVKGFRVVVALDTYVHHHANTTVGQIRDLDEVVLRNRKLFQNRWGVPVGEEIGIVGPFAPGPQAEAATAPPVAVSEWLAALRPVDPAWDAGSSEAARLAAEQLIARLPDLGRDVLVIGRGASHAVRLLRHAYGRPEALGLVPDLRAEVPYGVLEGEPHAIPLPDGRLDGVVAWRSLEHSAAPLVALLEINRVLRAGGHAALLVPAGGETISALGDAHWRRLIAAAGLTLLDAREAWPDGGEAAGGLRYIARKDQARRPVRAADATARRRETSLA